MYTYRGLSFDLTPYIVRWYAREDSLPSAAVAAAYPMEARARAPIYLYMYAVVALSLS